jgi:hypothetical protein
MSTMVKSSPEESSDSHRFEIAAVLTCLVVFWDKKTEDKTKVCFLLVILTGQDKTRQISACLVFVLSFFVLSFIGPAPILTSEKLPIVLLARVQVVLRNTWRDLWFSCVPPMLREVNPRYARMLHHIPEL